MDSWALPGNDVWQAQKKPQQKQTHQLRDAVIIIYYVHSS